MQAYIDAHHPTGGHVRHPALGLQDKLRVVAIGPAQESHPLDLLHGEGRDGPRAHQPHPPNATALGEGQVPPVGIQRPAGDLVLHRATVMLEAGIALLARTPRLAVLVEAANRLPGAVGSRLAGLGGEGCDEGHLVGQATAGELQVGGADPPSVHPEPQTPIAEELGDADGLVEGRALSRAHPEFVVVEEHLACRLRLAPVPHPGTASYPSGGHPERVCVKRRAHSSPACKQGHSGPFSVRKRPHDISLPSEWSRPPARWRMSTPFLSVPLQTTRASFPACRFPVAISVWTRYSVPHGWPHGTGDTQ